MWALPLVPVLSAVTPMVLGAFELFRRRQAAKEDRDVKQEEVDHMKSLASLEKRMRELEESDLEQARLVSEVSAGLEVVAQAVDSMARENQERMVRNERLAWLALVAGFLALSLSTWNSLR